MRGEFWRAQVDRRSVLAGLAGVGAFLAVDLGAVAYANDWIRPAARFTRQTVIDGLRGVYGTHLGFRKDHAKGVAVTGYFDSIGNAATLSEAVVFRAGRTPVVGRFSLAGGDPFVADTPGAARGLGLAFDLPSRQQWRTATLNLPVFPDNSAQGFLARAEAGKVVPGTGKPDPDAMAAFLRTHPETAAAMTVIKRHPPTTGFADSTFSGLNTFYAVDTAGVRTPVRWSFVPLQAALPPDKGRDGLFDALVRQIRTTPLQWRLELVVAEESDPHDDATLPWPADRRRVDAGTLTLTTALTESPGNARDVNFDPLVLPDGIEPSADPLLSARSSVYAASYRLRTGEPTSPSAVQVDEVPA
ncbi:catalase family peroxidase [Mycobacterium kyogaense]|uniref:catalase family peroxidase n=1 Tax=Mycobacterium kyogaense TaxID=2212479 RepID=UPI001F0971A7|nr:catalase family peroxidase [Mycobacterium kyogaense]